MAERHRSRRTLLGAAACALLWAATALADIYCPVCGIQYPDSYRYCPRDGFNLDEARAAAHGGDPGSASRPPAAPSPRTLAPPPSRPAPRTPSRGLLPAQTWAVDLPIHLPEGYPDANLGDFSLLEWSVPDADEVAIFSRIVLRKGKKGHISVLATTQLWPRAAAGDSPPSLEQVLAGIAPENSERFEWYDYRDFARSFRIDGRPLLSPFVGGSKVLRTYRRDYAINQGKVGCEVFEYLTQRDGSSVVHAIKTSQLVPYSFVESTYEGLGERLRVYLFGTLPGDEVLRLQQAFPTAP